MKLIKNIKSVAAAAMMAVAFFGCTEPEALTYKGDNFVSLDLRGATALEVKEGEEDITVDVILAFAKKEDITVDLAITETNAEEGKQYTISSKSIVIKAGEYSASFKISMPEDELGVEGDRKLNVAIESVSASDVKVGLADGVDASVLVNLIDNDCGFNIDDVVGTFSTIEKSYSSAEGDFVNPYGPYNVTVEAVDGDPLALDITGLWDYPGTVRVNIAACPRTVSYEPTVIGAHPTYGDVTLTQFWSDKAVISEDGNSIVIYGEATVAAGSFGSFKFELEK